MRRRVVTVGLSVLLAGSVGGVAHAGSAGKSAGGGNADPRSGAALNRDAALSPAPAPPQLFPESLTRRINAVAVNNPAADATAQDTQSETTIVVDGANVVAGWNDSGSFIGGAAHFTGFANSTNTGVSFTDRGALPVSAEGDAGDPVLASHDSSNSLYFSTLGFNTGENIQVFKSTNGGTSFGAPVNGTPGFAGTGDFQDKEWMAVDNAAGSGNGNVYLCWTRFISGGGAEIRMTRSTNAGASFTPSQGLLLSTGGQGCFVVVGPAHEVYVFYYRGTGASGQGGDNRLFVRKSTDRGLTFGAEVGVADLATTSVNGGLGLNGGLRSNSFPHAAVNPVSGDLVATYNDDPGPAAGTDRGDAFYVRSIDGGATWTAPVRVNDDAIRDQFFPTVSITPAGDRVMFGYYSRSHDSNNLYFHRRGRTAVMNNTTGAIALRRSFQLGPDNPVVIGQDPVINATYMGDYDQIDSSSTAFHTIWSDNRDGNTFHANQPDVQYAQIAATSPVTNADVSVDVVPTPATINQGADTSISLRVTANGAPARDVYVGMPPSPGLTFQSANGGCDLIDGFVGCSLGNFTAGQLKTRQVVATGAAPGTRSARAVVTTSDTETVAANNADSATITVNSVPSVTQTFSTGDLVTPIPDNTTVNVPLNVATAGTVLDVDAYVRLNHTFDSDLDMFLLGPGGAPIVELSTDNGASGDNYGNGTNNCAGTSTVFNDAAATSITAGTAPFAGSFKPEGLLSGFNGDPQNGQWTLRITDDAGADIGTVGCFKLRIRRPSP